MNELRNNGEATLGQPASERVESLRSQYESAWRSAVEGGEPPSLESFLTDVDEPERSVLESQLQRVADDYQRRLRDPASFQEATPSKLDAGHSGGESQLLESATVVHVSGADSAQVHTLAPGHTPAGEDVSFVLDQKPPAERAAGVPHVAGYEILGVLGRGGMGVVYKARQVALDRLVALKMILAGAHAGPTQLARFKAEAQAEARLHHPNIVQVYEIGEHNGLPYFSLEYVDGCSLSRLLAHQPQPARASAQLVETLARAMHYAHQQGIIHRDLKPGNILMAVGSGQSPVGSEDAASLSTAHCPLPTTLKIADFGLAKRINEDAGQTTTGTLLGTPSYMSPEQASGWTREIGPHSDQYALGAILYEMLVGRPPIQGVSMVETLALVRTQEPVPPRQLQPAVPADLETICLKCLQKEPYKRYANCGDLADDLRHFLNGEPIFARPVSAAERFWRWCHRNPRTALLASAVLLLLLVIALTSTGFAVALAQKQQETESARREAVENGELAERRATEAQAAGLLAEQRFELARKALEVVVNQVQSQLEDVPATHQVRKDILEAALKVFQEAEARSDGTGLSERGMAGAHLRLGDLLWQLDRRQEAVDHYRTAKDLAERLWRQTPDSDKAAGNYALMLVKWGELLRDLKRDFKGARQHYEQALKLQQEAAEHPRGNDWKHEEVLQSIAGTEQHLADLALRQGNAKEAEEYNDRAMRLREELYQGDKSNGNKQALANAYFNTGKLRDRDGDRTQALKRHEAALLLRQELVKENRQRIQFKRDLIASESAIGDIYLLSGGDPARAEEHYLAALAPTEQLAALFDTPQAQRDLSYRYYQIATAAQRLGRTQDADTYYGKCLKVREELAGRQPPSLSQDIDLMIARGRCGQYQQAAATAKALAEKEPKNARVLIQVACGYALCASAVVHGKKPDQVTEVERSLQRQFTGQAIATLRQAWANGFRAVRELETEPDLDPLRGNEQFEELLREFKYEPGGPRQP